MLLAVDTSTQSVGIALFDGNQILCEESWISRRYHTVELANAVQSNLSRAGLSAADLHVLAIASGPGSFTGLRIGMALIKGIAYTHQLSVIGIPTLDITARAVPVRDIRLAAVLQAGRNRLAVGWYKAEDGSWVADGLVENLTFDELLKKIDQPCILTGEINEEIRQAVEDHDLIDAACPTLALRNPKYLAELAWNRWQGGIVDDILTLSPTYLHRGDPIPG
ncbi:MAG: tRNA (adenosine(37)-N6)-threonylcarbamoyltransferase complex dimerization subunit type 1 TsaB [Anaerolineales bacterium]|nr:tRNA (adenosine(37)-N6)-threonylcarbamoyltransferase complex dimerization subunit type 1 TsaB [Anaerolineales bacterium]